MRWETSHIDNSFTARATADEFKRVPATRAAQKDWEEVLRLIREDQQRSHAEAAFIMQDFKVTGRPFALYLRSFETEAYHYLSKEGDPKGRRVLTSGHAQSECEAKLTAGLAGRVRALAVANPDQLTGSKTRLPRLLLPYEGWEAVVEDLVKAASFIVMECSALAPGVVRELDMLRAAKRENATVVVLPKEGAEAKFEQEAQMIEVFGGVVERHKLPPGGSDQLHGFERVAREDEINFDRLEESPLFADLLGEAKKKADAAPAFDAVRYGKQLNAAGVEMFNEERYAEAAGLLMQAVVLQRHTGDRTGLLTSLLNVGNNLVDAGQPEAARETYEEALAIAIELGRGEDEALLRRYVGWRYRMLGKIWQARRWLRGLTQPKRVPDDVGDSGQAG